MTEYQCDDGCCQQYNNYESGWLIELQDTSPRLYWSGDTKDAFPWTSDPDAAVRFARQQDGQVVAMTLGFATFVLDHGWHS